MTDTLATDSSTQVALPLNPFVANRYHFGMLLGVADFETEQAYHRGKSWLEKAWLHGSGVVWGLDVEVRPEHGEVIVQPGLAIDDHGRELVVSDPMCLDLAAWFGQRRPPDLDVTEVGDDIVFDVQVELCLDTCLDRPVPSISEPCDGASFDTAYSRVVERGVPHLVVPAPPPREQYPLLREFFGQVPAADPRVVAALAGVAAATPADRAATLLDAFRRIAAADVTALRPEQDAPAWMPFAGDGCVLLADLHVRLRPGGDRHAVVDGDEGTTVDPSVRPSHVRTRTIQELLCHTTEPAGASTAAALQAVAGSATLAGDALRLVFTRPLKAQTVQPAAFAVTALGEGGWAAIEVVAAVLDGDGVTVTLTLAKATELRPVRVVARGTGSAPLLADVDTVLSGVTGDPVVTSGGDAALMVSASSEEE